MIALRYLLSILIGSIVLFVWYGVAQNFPWGPPIVSNFNSTSGEPYVMASSKLEQAIPGTWTTKKFEEQFAGRISTLATDRSFSWIISAPREHYHLGKYFRVHFLTQLGVAVGLLFVSHLLRPLSAKRRFATVLSFGVVTALAVYCGMLNWMGMPAQYGLGQCFNHIMAWSIAFLIMEQILYRQKKV